jgi:hypothetical protein
VQRLETIEGEMYAYRVAASRWSLDFFPAFQVVAGMVGLSVKAPEDRVREGVPVTFACDGTYKHGTASVLFMLEEAFTDRVLCASLGGKSIIGIVCTHAAVFNGVIIVFAQHADGLSIDIRPFYQLGWAYNILRVNMATERMKHIGTGTEKEYCQTLVTILDLHLRYTEDPQQALGVHMEMACLFLAAADRERYPMTAEYYKDVESQEDLLGRHLV